MYPYFLNLQPNLSSFPKSLSILPTLPQFDQSRSPPNPGTPRKSTNIFFQIRPISSSSSNLINTPPHPFISIKNPSHFFFQENLMVTTSSPTTTATDTTAVAYDGFSRLSDDMLLDILSRLSSDPRDWSRLSCVSSRFAKLIGSICCRSWCSLFIPTLTSDLLSGSDELSGGWAALRKLSMCCPGLHHAGVLLDEYPSPKCFRRPIWEPHFASVPRGFSREEGSKLLASRFRSDCLYISQWPGCVHSEKRRKYLLFRGVFKDFKHSSVWQAVSDAKKSRIEAKCAFCLGKETWDLHSAFCLRRGLDFHEGEPVVRAFVCMNGHVSGAWVEKPLYL